MKSLKVRRAVSKRKSGEMGSLLQHERFIKGGLPSFRFKVRVGVEDRKIAFAESYHLMDGQLY